jgi:beta-lactamase class A
MTTETKPAGQVQSELDAIFDAANTTGYVHGRDVDGDDAVGIRSDEPVVLASVFKIPVLLELCRRSAAGELDPTERVRVTSADRVLGPTGLSVVLDDVELSWRDLAYLMMSVSDNTATDVIMRRLGLGRIQATLAELGLQKTKLVGDCADLLGTFEEDVGVALTPGLRYEDIDPAKLSVWRSIDPERTSCTTPEEITRLLGLIWRDEAGTPEACAEARRIMYLQVWPHRLTSGFPDALRLGAKTGTLPGIRNEAGVVEFPDGKRYAVAVFTRARTFVDRQPEVDAAIGKAARVAVDALRSRS